MRFSPLRAARFNGSWSSGGSVIAGKPDSTPKRERVSFRRVRPRPISKTSRPKVDCEKVTVREVWPATKGAGGGRNDTYDAGERYPVAMDIITAQVSTSVFLSRRSRGSEGPAVPGASKEPPRVGKPYSSQESRLGVSRGDEGSPMNDSGLSPD